MKILFIHNRYGIVSGEEIMIERIVELLRSNGHDVRTHFRDSRDIGTSRLRKTRAFFSGIYSLTARRELRGVLGEFQPDIVQVQNLYPLISPSVLSEIKQAGIPIVMRLSNYRLVCPSGLLFSHDQLCERCLGGKEYWCVLRNCEGSMAKSAGYAVRNAAARLLGLYKKSITRFYAQTTFQKDVLVSEGFSANQIDVIPNMVEPPSENSSADIGEYVGFVGRMSTEKGVDVILDVARQCPDIPFKIAGTRRQNHLDDFIPDNVETLGHLSRDALDQFYRNCRFVVVPSLWYEGFPSVIIESMRCAKPVIASRIGGLPEIVEDGLTGRFVQPGDPDDLELKVRELWEDNDAVSRLGSAARAKVVKEFLPTSYYDRLIFTYEKAISQVASEH